MSKETLRELLGETRAEGFEGFDQLIAFAETLDLTPEERMRARMIRLFAVAAVEGASEATADGRDALEAVIASAMAAGYAVATLMVQVLDREGFGEGSDLLIKEFTRGLRFVADYAEKAGEDE